MVPTLRACSLERLALFRWVGVVRMLAPPLNFLYVAIQQSGSSKPLSRLKRSLSGFVRMLSEGFRIAERASKAFVRARVRESYRKKREHLLELGCLTAELEEGLDVVDYEKVTRLSHAAAERTHADCKQRHVRKLESLLSRSKKNVDLRPEGQARWVVNLPKRSLTPSQEEVLKKVLTLHQSPQVFRCRILLHVWKK